jgi:hypothetical protein
MILLYEIIGEQISKFYHTPEVVENLKSDWATAGIILGIIWLVTISLYYFNYFPGLREKRVKKK